MNFWNEAQKKETDVWLRSDAEPFSQLKKRAELMFNYLYLDTDKVSENLNALEIGGANAPVITLLKFKLRYIVDPIFENIKEKIPDVYAPKEDDKVYSEAAENLNFISDNTLDAIFCLNVLDHTEKPELILNEIHRVMKPDGRALLSIDYFSFFWLLLRSVRVKITGKKENDILHPHHFTLDSLVSMLKKNNFKLARGFIAPGDGFSKSSNYNSNSEYPFINSFSKKIKSAARFYVVITK